MEILEVTDQNRKRILAQAAAVLKQGGLVIYPTETAYGVAALATSTDGVSKLLAYKRRHKGKAISIAVTGKNMAHQYVVVNDEADRIYDEFLPGPVTVISNSKGKTDSRLESERNTLGIRIPDHKLALDLISAVGEPITATSANIAGKKTPYSIDDVLENTSAKQQQLVDLAIDYGVLPKVPTSTVIDTTTIDMQVIRTGAQFVNRLKLRQTIKSDSQMQKQGETLISSCHEDLDKKAIMILLEGELGTGKTQFTKGVAKGLGITETVSSPTYSIVQEYDFKQTGKNAQLIHIDAWRLQSAVEFAELEIEQYLQGGNVIVLEWAGATRQVLKSARFQKLAKVIEVKIEYLSPSERLLRIYE